MSLSKVFCSAVCAFALSQPVLANERPSQTEAQVVIQAAVQNAMSLRIDAQASPYWNLQPYLGTHYISQYYLLTQWMGRTSALLNTDTLKQRLLAEQLADGSWYTVPDLNLASGDLNATILNYWALKALGMDTVSDPLARARKFILSRGGVERSSRFTQIVLALFGNFSWEQFPSVPYLMFLDASPVNVSQFGQWIGPHLMPIAYLKEMRVNKDLGSLYRLDELWSDQRALGKLRARPDRRKRPHTLSPESLLMIKMLGQQQPAGSFGGYTLATLFTVLATNDYHDYTGRFSDSIDRATQKGLQFIESLYFESGDSAYKGVTCDGRYWDTVLIGNALLDAGVPGQEIAKSLSYLNTGKAVGGGLAFGLDFNYAPDTDDTGELLILTNKLGLTQTSYRSEVDWLIRMQNKDGGWGAFARNNTGNAILRAAAREFEDSADLFDESSVDVTAHILEAFGGMGLTAENSVPVYRAIEYIKSQQTSFGAWQGRWGLNYLYGTGAAVVALLKVGEDPSEAYIQSALHWMISKQNADGGFGETTRSYDDVSLAGKGISTPSQTAWVLLALVEAGLGKTPAADNAAAYLVREFNLHGKWIDSSTVGTGHPSIVYMNYPSYAYAFPLSALARWAR